MRMSVQRARFVPVVLGVAVLGATIALRAHAALSSHTAVSSTLHAIVREDASIALTYDDGSDVGSQGRTPPSIPPGAYTVRVSDTATIHNFHLFGPGVDVATPVDLPVARRIIDGVRIILDLADPDAVADFFEHAAMVIRERRKIVLSIE